MLLRLLKSAFQSRPSSAPLVRRALELRGNGRLADAEQTLRNAVDQDPRDAVALTNLAVALLEQDRAQEAVAYLERAIEYDGRCAAAHFNYANVLRASGRLDDAIAHYCAANDADPRFAAAPEQLMHAQLEACDWQGARTVADRLREMVAREPAAEWMPFISPLTAVYLRFDDEQIKQAAAFHSPPAPKTSISAAPVGARRVRDGRIRLAYISRDFRDHAVGHLLGSVFSLHDRERFEVLAFSYGADDRSAYRTAIARSVDNFVDIAGMTDDAAARAISDAGVDVLVDLMGHTTGNRLALLARRPAPVQAHYLGYAGTTGAPYIDYFVSDETATPRACATAFTEEIAYVPDCFMVSDGADARIAPGSTRAEHDLPESAYVFCNFANASRITEHTFGLWMEALKAVPSSVLWLKRAHGLVVQNLRRRAQNCGVDPNRVKFAERVRDKPAHLGRAALADLALDTIGWHNGHTTTADMLWSGIPVLTSPGDTFASRVATSLVRAAGLSEAITANAEAYLARAIELARSAEQTKALHARLDAQRPSAPFFDTGRLIRGLEQAYETMFADKMRRFRGSVAQSVRAGDS